MIIVGILTILVLMYMSYRYGIDEGLIIAVKVIEPLLTKEQMEKIWEAYDE